MDATEDLAAALLELDEQTLEDLIGTLTADEIAALEESLPAPKAALAAAREQTADPIRWARTTFPALVPLEPGPHHRALGELLDPERPTGVRAVVGAPRGSGKSTVGLTLLPIVAAVRLSHRFAVVLRAKEDDAVTTVEGIRAILTARPDLLDAYPWLRPVNRERGELRLAGGLVILARGAGSAIRGLTRTVGGRAVRPDLVVCDDLETEESARSKLQTDRLEEWLLSVVGQLGGPPGDVDAQPLDVVWIGTTLEPEAVTARALNGQGPFQGWTRLRFPAEAVVRFAGEIEQHRRGDDGATLDPKRLVAVDAEGEPVPIDVPTDATPGQRIPLWPDGMPLAYLDRLTEARPDNAVFVGGRIYAREYLLRPQARGDAVFARSSTRWVDRLAERIIAGEIPAERAAEGVDPAASERDSADYSALAVTVLLRLGDVPDLDLDGTDPDTLAVAVLSAERGRWSLSKLLDATERVAGRFAPLGCHVAFEAQGAFLWGAQELRKRGKVAVRPVSVSTDKLVRATPLSVWHEAGRVIVDSSLRGSPWDHEFHGFTGTNADGFDDLVDATVHAAAYSTSAFRKG